MPGRVFQLALCQLQIVDDKSRNINRARDMIRRAAALGSELVILPEMFNCPYQARLFPSYAETYPGGETLEMLASTAAGEGVYLVGGSIPERDGSQVYNTSFVFGPDGRLLGRHRKIHLFDVDLPGLSVRESSTLGAGEELSVIETGLCTLGVVICYDIRFPELIRLLALRGVQLLVAPAAFNMTTGPAHWDLVFRGRAVDNQLFVAAASPARDPAAPYVAYGHSMVVDPWGNKLAEAAEGETILTAEIAPGLAEEIRGRLPLLRHRRPELYHKMARKNKN
ncbi:MAG: carbon-nitrogen hydrolase family protein [Bacillota bacterium]